MTATEITPYTPPAIEEYRARLAMTPDDAKALDDQLRACTRAVLREGTDYGIIPGTNGDKTLFRPGAQKLLQWFGLGFTCDRVEIDAGDDGQRQGVTYRATVTRRLPDGSLLTVSTCEGYAGYDEDKFYQDAGQVQRKAEARERMWAKKDRRVANPEKWRDLPEYRAPWNSVIKRAQKRAIVGATIDATAAGGLFSQEQEEDDGLPAGDDGRSWYEQALEVALTFTEKAQGQELWRDAARAARDGLCTPGQANHVQNRIQQRIRLLATATPVDVEDLAQAAERSAAPVPDGQAPSGPAAAAEPEPESEAPVPVTTAQLTAIGRQLGKLRVDDEHRLSTLAKLAGRDLASPGELTRDEAEAIRGLLGKCGGDPGALVELLATGTLDAGEEAI